MPNFDINILKFDKLGLIPAIAQDHQTLDVLMLAWMNKESIQSTLSTGLVHYFSRSRGGLWKKGETSGHFQELKEAFYDCDADSLLLRIKQHGGISCHTGQRSCFFNKIDFSSKVES